MDNPNGTYHKTFLHAACTTVGEPVSPYQGSILSPANKQLLDEVEHDIMNYQNRGLCYLPKPKAEEDNTDLGFDNS